MSALEVHQLVGRTVSHYRILEKLGEGGMGEVYKAVDTRIGRTVAMKFMKAGFDERVRREAAAISALNHPNIATLYDIGEHEDSSFLVMEFIEGETLREKLASSGLSEEEVTALGTQIALALEEAHEHGVVHRDLKPSNIIVTPKGQAKVLDFGLAKLRRPVTDADSTLSISKTPKLAGTPAYMPPEQLRGEDLDGRADIHALGVVLYEMATGQAPYRGATLPLLTDAILNRAPAAPREVNPRISPPLEAIILKCLEKDPKQRYQSAVELLADLRQASSSAPAGAVPAGLAAVPRTLQGRRLLILSGAALALVLTLVVWLAAPAGALTDKDVILIADFENRTGDPMFTGSTLKDALAFKLMESPFLNIYPAEEVRETLRLMGRASDSRIDEETGREICIRRGLKAMVTGSIAPLGSKYIIQLKVVGAQSRSSLAMTEAEASSKEDVIRQLGKAASGLRKKTGEALTSSGRFDVPLEQATTSSLEALKAFSTGVELRDRGQFLDALSHYKRATELDPDFALAHVQLGNMYGNADQRGLMREEVTKAFGLRQRVSERERLIIEVRYYGSVVGDSHREMAAEKLLAQAYPRYWMAHNNLGVLYRTIGRHEEAIVEFEEAMRLSPRSAGFGHSNLAWTYLFLGRHKEAEEHANHALSAGFDSGGVHQLLYLLGAIRGDFAAMERQIGWFSAKPQEYFAHRWQGDFAAFSGELKKARQFHASAAQLAESRGSKERLAIETAWSASIDAQVGFCGDVAGRTGRALASSRETSVLRDSADALAQCGRLEPAEALMRELAQNHPQSTYVNEFLLPNFRALVQIQRGNFRRAIELLQPLLRYERTASGVRSAYLRGVAYRGAGDGNVAAAEFQKILNNRGLEALSIFYPLAHLELGRASAAMGDRGAARKAYEEFFRLWKNADSDVPILREAKAEYSKL